MQVAQDDIQRIALTNLLATCAGQEAFTQLRTHEQLGYTVFLGRWRHLTMHSLALIIQSNVYGPAHLEARAEDFLQSYEQQLSGMDAATFADQARAGLLIQHRVCYLGCAGQATKAKSG